MEKLINQLEDLQFEYNLGMYECSEKDLLAEQDKIIEMIKIVMEHEKYLQPEPEEWEVR